MKLVEKSKLTFLQRVTLVLVFQRWTVLQVEQAKKISKNLASQAQTYSLGKRLAS